jgi:hypothetical protein
VGRHVADGERAGGGDDAFDRAALALGLLALDDVVLEVGGGELSGLPIGARAR